MRKPGSEGIRTALPQKVCTQFQCLLVSFTPGFSQVLQNVKSPGNRLNGFLSEGQLSVTWLKPGVNKKEQITFEAKPYIHCATDTNAGRRARIFAGPRWPVNRRIME